MGTLGCVYRRVGGQEFVVDSEARMRMVSKRQLTLPSWRRWGCRGILRRWWRPIQRKSDSVCQSGKYYLTKFYWLKKLQQFFQWRHSVKNHGYTHHWTSGEKPHLIRNGKRIDYSISNLMYHLWFVVHQRFLLHLRFHFSFHHRHPWSHCVPKKKVRTANGEVQTREEATVFVKELDFFVNVMLLEETTAVLPFGKLCEVWKELIHTSHFLVFACTHNSGAHDIRSRLVDRITSSMLHVQCLVWSLFGSPLCTLHRPSHLLLSFFWSSSLSSMWVRYTPLTRGSWVNLPLDQRSKTTSLRKWQEHQLQYIALRTTRCPCINEFFYVIYTYLFNIFIAGFCDLRGQSRSRKKWKCDRILAVKPIA